MPFGEETVPLVFLIRSISRHFILPIKYSYFCILVSVPLFVNLLFMQARMLLFRQTRILDAFQSGSHVVQKLFVRSEKKRLRENGPPALAPRDGPFNPEV